MTDGHQLRDWLAGRTGEQLATILELRPDAIWGAPLRGLGDLAARLVQPASVGGAVAELALPGFELLHALTALGPAPTVQAAAALLDAGGRGPDAQRDVVRSVLGSLSDRALAWPVEAGIAVNPGARLVISRPLGLGRTVASHLEHAPVDQLRALLRNLGLPDAAPRADVCDLLEDFLTDRDRVQELLRTAPASAQRRLRALATTENEPLGYHPKGQADREGENWARRRGLLFGGEYYQPEVPVEIILAVRADELSASFHPEPPRLATTSLAAEAIRAGASAAATEFTETVAGVLDLMTRMPPPALKAGGIGTREVSRIAKSMRVADTQVRFALELLRDLGLLAGVDGRMGGSEVAQAWRSAEPSARFADLVVTWWGLPIAPTVTHDVDGKPFPAAGRRAVDAAAIGLRSAVIETIGAQPTGVGVVDQNDVTAMMAWQLPKLIARDDPMIATIWLEAHRLGVLAQGALTAIGRALLAAEPDALLTATSDLLAPASTLGRFGSDLTVMVAGAPAAAVSALLDSCADRESRGAAVVWRFSPASVRRALDEGSSADELRSALRAIAETELPQPLTYLIGDVARRHGALTVQPALCCIRSDDQALLIEVAAHRGLRSARPVLLAPTVIACAAEPDAVLEALRGAGYMPVLADERGVVHLGRAAALAGGDSGAAAEQPDRRVDRLVELRSRARGGSAGDPVLLELASALLAASSFSVAGDSDREPTEVEAAIDAFGQQLDPTERRQLAFAIENQVPVTITYTSSTGGVTTRIISDIELVNGLMYAWCHLRDDDRVFTIDRVQAVAPVNL